MADWETKTLGELCEFQRGLTYGKSDEVDASKNVVLRANNVDLATHTLDLTDLRYISNSITIPAAKKVRKGSLLICTASGSKSHLGKIAYVDEDYGYAFGGFMGQITPTPGIYGRYLFHALTSSKYKAFIEALSDGVNINNLKFDDLRQFSVSVPPLPEQQRIVAILDEAFEGIATAKANAEKNLQNARELFENYHQSVFSREGEGWVDYRLGEIASFRNGINFTQQSKGRSVPIIGVKNFQNHLWAPLDDLDSVTLDGELSELDTLAEGDILSVRSNGNPELIGRCMLVGSLSEPITHSGFTIRIRLHDGNTLPQYVCQFLKSRDVRRTLIDGGNGANIRSLNQGTLSSVVIPLPPIEIQQRLINEIEAMHSKTAYLADIASRKLSALDELKKSLLHQAFTGQL